MAPKIADRQLIRPEQIAFYRRALTALQEAEVPFLLGGGYAFFARTSIARATKDIDIFLLPADVRRALATLAAAGYETELTYPHWLAKAYSGNEFMDIIFNSGNGHCPVDARWFEHASPTDLEGLSVMLCPPEETIWQKAFILERDRCDVTDVIHLLRACGPTLDWDRVLARFGAHWRVLLAQLLLFEYTFPDDRSVIPERVMQELARRLGEVDREPPETPRTCYGTLLSRDQFNVALTDWHYADARLLPPGSMTPEEVDRWTKATD